MSVLRSEIRPGAYYDSIVLLQLRASLARLPGVIDAAAVMATRANLELLRSSDLLPPGPIEAGPDDLLLVVEAVDATAAAAALAQVDGLVARTRGGAVAGEYRPRGIAAARRQAPHATWATISVPGRHASGVARDCLRQRLNVFLFSDNVPLADEVSLKQEARARALLLMGPDCGTAIVGGIGLGFANRVRRGGVGLVGASGTGLQTVGSRIHALGGGISHALGTGSRDLHAQVGAVAALQGLDLLARDQGTEVLVLVAKPPDPAVAERLWAAARRVGKPAVVCFLGAPVPARRLGNLRFACDLADAASLAMELQGGEPVPAAAPRELLGTRRYLRGLFSGGTLALETLQGLRSFLSPLFSNLAYPGVEHLPHELASRGHAVLDLGSDELTVGRLHPMIDHDLRLRRLRAEAEDPEVALILLDVVLGDGSHADPAGALAPAIAEHRTKEGLQVVVLLVGTDLDPQDLDAQTERLERAGATVFLDPQEALSHVLQRLAPAPEAAAPPVPLSALERPAAVINVGIELFSESLAAQGVPAVQVDWCPPAGGDERLMAILHRLR